MNIKNHWENNESQFNERQKETAEEDITHF